MSKYFPIISISSGLLTLLPCQILPNYATIKSLNILATSNPCTEYCLKSFLFTFHYLPKIAF